MRNNPKICNSKIRDKYDAIVIGSGVGGLVSAARLTKNGLKVLVLEKNHYPGGCVSSFKRKNFIFDCAAHIVGSAGKFQIFDLILKNLDVKIDFMNLDPAERIQFSDSKFEIPNDIDLFREKLIMNFPSEEKSINNFFDLVKKIWRRFSSGNFSDPLIRQFEDKTFIQVLDNIFISPKLKAIISSQFVYAGNNLNDISALAMFLLLGSYLKDGCFYPKRGMQEIPEAIVNSLRSHKGQIVFNQEVDKIFIKGNNVVNLSAKDGSSYEADFFISNIDARKTFFGLIGEGNVEEKYLDNLKKLKAAKSFFLVYLGLNDSLEKLSRLRGFYFSSDDFDKGLDYFLVFNPPGKNILHIVVPLNDDSAWDKGKKANFEDKILKKMQTSYPEILEKIVYKESAASKTIENYTANFGGSPYGWSNIPSQTLQNRLSQVTPFENLFLAGHWTRPGSGVVAVALSGWNAAGLILDKLKKG